MLGAFARFVFGMVRSRAILVAENDVLRQQLVAAKCRLRGKRVRWSPWQRWMIGALATSTERTAGTLVQPETALRWHRMGWRLFWRWRSRPGGRPATHHAPLVRQMSASNPRWGAERLRGELLKLGIHISKRTVQKYMTRRAPDGGPASVLVPMSEFLHLGLPLEQVIAGVTATPGKMLNYPEKVGTLQAGATADVAILELAQGSFEYRDGGRQPRTLKQQFVPVATVKGGIFLKGAPGAAQLTR